MGNNTVIRSKTHCLELYPDCIDHYTLIQDILYSCVKFECGYAAILHDMDVYDDEERKGEYKKPHYHIVFALSRECSKSAFINRVHVNYPKVADNYFYTDSREHGIKYLIHKDDPDKYQYNADLIISYKLDVIRYLKKEFIADEEDKIFKILDHVNSCPKETRDELVRWVLSNSLWSEFRRSYSIINDIIKERKERLSYDIANEVIKSKRDILHQVDSLRESLYNVRKDVSKLNNDRVLYMRSIGNDEDLPF